MAQSLISCPVCSSPSFSNTSTLCLALVNVASKWLRCTMCEEELRGLDKLTIHLLGHLIHSPGFKRVLSNDTSDARSVLSSQPLNLIKNQSEQAKQNTTEPVSDVDPTALQSNIENERPSLKIDDEVMIFFNSDNTNKHSPGAKENVVRTLDNETGSVSGLPKFTINFEKTATQSESISHCENLGKTSNRNLVEESSLNHSLQYFLPFNHENQNMINPVKEHELQMELCHEKEKEVPNLLETGQTTGVCNKISCSLENTENKIGLKNSYLSPKGERVVGFRCDICSLVFPDENILSMHRQLIHVELGSTEPTSYKCHLCSKSFVMKGSLMVHMRVAHFGGAVVARLVEAKQLETNAVSPDSAQFVCSVCNKGFQKEQQLALHEKLHDGKQCDICFKTFTTKYFLRKHKRLHTGEMPYQCSQCNKSFTFQQSYHKHLLYHSDDKPYTCSDCGRSFKELSTLHNHQRIHTGEKPFSCETCGKCFRQRVSYLVHRRIHTGVMPYRCQDCGKTFRYKVSERTHKCFTSTANSGTDVSTPLLSEAKCDDPATFLADENNQSGSNNEQVKIPDNTELKQSLAESEMYPEPADFFSLVMSPSDRLQNLSLASEVEADMSPSDRGRIDSEALKQLLYDVADYS